MVNLFGCLLSIDNGGVGENVCVEVQCMMRCMVESFTITNEQSAVASSRYLVFFCGTI